MSGKKLTQRVYSYLGNWTDKDFQLQQLKELSVELKNHIEMQDKKINQLNRKNNKLERKYWEIKLKYEVD
mgnify:CR=1 FL=1